MTPSAPTPSPLLCEQIAEAIADARLWPGVWSKMGDAERDTCRWRAEAVMPLVERAIREELEEVQRVYCITFDDEFERWLDARIAALEGEGK